MPLGEFGLIADKLKPLAEGYPGALALTDDAALLNGIDGPGDGVEFVIAKDALVEGVHFLSDDPPATVGQKLLRCNLSDLAAMGAKPHAYLTALFLPPTRSDEWLGGFIDGLIHDQNRFQLHLIGGDITSTPGPLCLSCTVIGTVPTSTAIRRDGAKPGDQIWVSGHLGEAALGLRVAQGLAADEETTLKLLDRYRVPQPRIELGQHLRGIAHAMIDISDGLLADLGHIAQTSNVRATVHASRLPLTDPARSLPGALDAALSGGDDYELLFTAPLSASDAINRIAASLALPVTPIGDIEAGSGVAVIDDQGMARTIDHRGWQHR